MRNINFKYLEMSNFKVHEYLKLDLQPNRFMVITGNNGAGKSSIFDSIFWALYDETTKGLDGDAVIRHRSKGNTSVKITFDIDNDQYEISNYRKHKKFGDNKYLIKNGIDISASTRRETNNIISKIVMPKNVFLNCLLFSQYMKESFTELKHSGKKDILDSILNFGMYDEYGEKVSDFIKFGTDKINILNTEIDQINIKISSNEKILEDTINSLGIITKNYEDVSNNIRRDIDIYKSKLDDKDSIYDKYNSIKKINTELISYRMSIDSKLQEMEREYESSIRLITKEIASDTNHKIKEIENKYCVVINNLTNELNKEKNTLSNINVQKERKINELKTDSIDKKDDLISRFTKYETSIKEEILQLEKSVNNITNNNNSINKNILKISSDLNSIKNGINKSVPVCSMCGQNINDNIVDSFIEKCDNYESDIKKLKSEMDNNDVEINRIKNLISEKDSKLNEGRSILEHHLDKLRSSFSEDVKYYNNSILPDIEHHNKLISEISIKLSDSNGHKNDEISKIKKYYDELKRSECNKILNEFNENRDKLKEQYEIYDKKIYISSLSLENIEKMKSEIDIAVSMIKTKESELLTTKTTFDKSKTELGNRISNLSSIIESDKNIVTEKLGKISSGSRSIEIMKFWKTAFSDTGIKSLLLDESVPILNKKASELTKLLDNIIIHFSSQSTLKSGETKNKFSVSVLNTKNLSTLDELSKGETRMVNIIVLICIRHLMETIQDTKLNLMLFDEVLDSLDTENVIASLNTIRQLSKDHFVALITHTFRDYIECDETLNL